MEKIFYDEYSIFIHPSFEAGVDLTVIDYKGNVICYNINLILRSNDLSDLFEFVKKKIKNFNKEEK